MKFHQNDTKNIIDPLLIGHHELKQHTWQRLKKIFGELIFDNKNILTCYRVIPAQVTQFSKKSPGDHLRFDETSLMCAFMFRKIVRKNSVQNSK